MAQNIIIYPSHFELMESLSNEQAGILIKSIGLFRLGKEPTITDQLVLGIFTAIKRDFIIQSENYKSIVERNRLNGKNGGRPKTQSNPQNPMGSLVTQTNPNNLKDKDKDKDKDIDYTSTSTRQDYLAKIASDTMKLKPSQSALDELDKL